MCSRWYILVAARSLLLRFSKENQVPHYRLPAEAPGREPVEAVLR